jgi:hypothetical protein
MSQIWLQKSRIFLGILLCFGYLYRKVLSKYGNLRLSFPQNMATLALFPQKILCTICNGILFTFVAKMPKFSKFLKNKNKMIPAYIAISSECV